MPDDEAAKKPCACASPPDARESCTPAGAALNSVVGPRSVAARLPHQLVDQQADRSAHRRGIRHLLSSQSHWTADVPAGLESSKTQETRHGARSPGNRTLETRRVAAH